MEEVKAIETKANSKRQFELLIDEDGEVDEQQIERLVEEEDDERSAEEKPQSLLSDILT